MSEAAVSCQAATGRDPPQAEAAGGLRVEEAKGKQGAEPGGVGRGEEAAPAQDPGPLHPLGLQEPETGSEGVRGSVALAFLQENGLELVETSICCPLLPQEREREEFLMSPLNLTFFFFKEERGIES